MRSHVLDDLLAVAESTARARRVLPGVHGQLLWRYSVADPTWLPVAVEAIDYSSMMLGLAVHRFGPAIVEGNNDVETRLAGVP